jgi:hypothetical protein
VQIEDITIYSAVATPKVSYFRKRINPSMELLKPSLASKVPETLYLWHLANILLNSYKITIYSTDQLGNII